MSLLLSIQNVGKSYRVYRSESHRFASWFGLPVKPSEEHWVLRHMSFEVYSGEAVGVVGQNGAGKSTLLKMIAGTLKPTEGKIQINGRIAAILELGMGFNPELTGRQNAIHALGLMGFNAEEVHKIIPKVEVFSEIGEYFDEPVRTYSSGMQMRVAFSVATAYRPEILIVDEALSVGDTYFQHKSFSRIREFQEQGTTLLIVSHDRSAIQSLCNRAILLENGAVIKDGDPEEVFDFYNAIIAEKENNTVEVKKLDNNKVQTSSGTGEAEVYEISMLDKAGSKVDTVGVGDFVEFQLKVKINENIESLVMGFGVKDRLGQMMFGTNTFHTKQLIETPKKGEEYVFNVSCEANLGVGSYSVHFSLVQEDNHIAKNFQWVDRALMFNVVNFSKYQFVGSSWNQIDFKITKDSMISNEHKKKKYSRENNRSLTILDIGCRWGFADKFVNDTNNLIIYGFDPDAEECERLEKHYNNSNIKLIPLALSDKSGISKLYLTSEPACSSLYKPNKVLTENYPALHCAQEISQIEVKTSTLNDWLKETDVNSVDYIKIDTQGSELNILRGATNILSSVRFLEVEVEFNPIYDGQPVFSEIDLFLRKHGFMLWKFSNLVCYSKDGESNITLPNNSINYDEHRYEFPVRGGQIYWADAFYIQKDIIDVKYNKNSIEQIKRDSSMASRLGFLDLRLRLDKELTRRGVDL